MVPCHNDTGMTVGAGSRFRIGVDENGLGPRLGPLIVTAAMARVSDEAELVVDQGGASSSWRTLGDSKGLVAHGDVALGEAWTRAVVARGAGKRRTAGRPDDLLHAVALDEPEWLHAPCPAHVTEQCWGTSGEALRTDARFEQLLRTVEHDLDRLTDCGIDLVALRSVVVCCERLNDAARQGRNRLLVDLHAMERLVVELREKAGQEVIAVCGKVGGFQNYPKVLGPLGGRPCAVLEQGRRRSAYHIAGIGDVAFVQNCDDSDLLVGLASLVGKYLRELLMERIVRFYQRLDPSVPAASGYHDPVTSRFIEATKPLREAARVPSGCFRRAAAD